MCVHSPESRCEARGIRQSMSSSTSLHVKYCQQGTEAVFMHFKNKKEKEKKEKRKIKRIKEKERRVKKKGGFGEVGREEGGRGC